MREQGWFHWFQIFSPKIKKSKERKGVGGMERRADETERKRIYQPDICHECPRILAYVLDI